MNEKLICAAIDIAYEAGKWHGQVELEQHFDNEQYACCALEVLHAKKYGGPSCHASTGKSVTINLRSHNWRVGVVKSSGQYKKIALKMLGCTQKT